jgi:hypothetical protein
LQHWLPRNSYVPMVGLINFGFIVPTHSGSWDDRNSPLKSKPVQQLLLLCWKGTTICLYRLPVLPIFQRSAGRDFKVPIMPSVEFLGFAVPRHPGRVNTCMSQLVSAHSSVP